MRRAIIGIAVAGVLALALAGLSYRAWLHRPHASWDGGHVDVVLDSGLAAGAMFAELGAAGVVHRPQLLQLWIKLSGQSTSLRAGEYRFDTPASPLEIVERLKRGDVLLHAVTVPEGLTADEIATRFVEHGFGDEEEWPAAMSRASLIADLDAGAGDLEGYLFPDTYHFQRGTGAGEIVEAMLRRFREVLGADYVERAQAVGLDLREAVTLASMIEAETGLAGERRRISRVFHNRLRRGMRMQCDPTVIYALRRAKRPPRKLTYADLEIESPWNTYRVRGLPVGPIGSPGRASLEAAVDPLDGSELYFVAKPDGGHRFSETLEGHHRAVAEWRAYTRSSR
ncbi:MAG: endolytic transglycosylase MltG [bacterium]|nr:endolytic transglycosylase MltG [bacterium]